MEKGSSSSSSGPKITSSRENPHMLSRNPTKSTMHDLEAGIFEAMESMRAKGGNLIVSPEGPEHIIRDVSTLYELVSLNPWLDRHIFVAAGFLSKTLADHVKRIHDLFPDTKLIFTYVQDD